jgi:hypothetical protein
LIERFCFIEGLKQGGAVREIGEMEAIVVDVYGKNQSSLSVFL